MFGKAPSRPSVAHQVPLRREVKAASAQVVSCGVVTKENKRLPMRAGTARQNVVRQGPRTGAQAFLSGVTAGQAKPSLCNIPGWLGRDVRDL